ncbi:hypothetical protein A4A49_36353 [Nicotiana attenuata]|uniref:Uncharacterized protein n=1 Tax=Nicotiana attenuata TaxID=49451 RepID=A0A1J6K8B1_NICAT|nr:hypothetical protein A4A49_36353 [Nicotiana attenuata]
MEKSRKFSHSHSRSPATNNPLKLDSASKERIKKVADSKRKLYQTIRTFTSSIRSCKVSMAFIVPQTRIKID